MDAPQDVRIDKWLWAVRVFKTRSLATDACRGGGVEVGGQKVKPSHSVKLQEVIQARVGQITRTVKVLGLLEHRVSASVVKDFCEDLTPPEEYERPKEPNFRPLVLRPKGLGRPTKKDRRKIERIWEP